MDKFLLEYTIKSNGHTIAEYCKAIGISKSSYYKKVRGDSDFTQEQIQKSIDFLKLESPVPIFFKSNVS
mgnify:CR=1 FL=1